MEVALAISAGAYVGSSLVNSIFGAHSQRKSQREQRKALKAMQEEIGRQRQREEDQQRRENMQLMNSVSNLTNTSFSGVSSPTIAYDKYGDLG